MFSLKQTMSNQSGSTLIIVVLVLLAVTMMGLASINISSIDINLAGNEKFQKQVFTTADAGLHGTPNIIGMTWEFNVGPADSNPGDGNCLNYLNALDPQSFVDLLMARRGTGGCDLDDPTLRDITFRNCGVTADVDICFSEWDTDTGGGAEFLRAADGLGIAAENYAKYRIRSTGQDLDGTTYMVSGHYIWKQASGGMK